MINKSEAEQFGTEAEKIFSNKNKQQNDTNLNDIYVFVSFDLVNSTKLKYQYSNWLRLIKNLITYSNSDWVGLTFWKYNGDELLFFAKITALNQLADILERLYKKQNELIKYLRDLVLNDDNSNFAEDLVGIKTSIWMASISESEGALNSKLDGIDVIDFAGINMDEGFRMSKCATQNKLIVDPKIVFLLCLINEGFDDTDKMNQIEGADINNIDINKPNMTLDEILIKFIRIKNNITSLDSIEYSTKAMFKTISNNFRIVGYEICKGVWNGRKYPIIWFSDNWKQTIRNVKYDECFADEIITDKLIDSQYENIKDGNYYYKTTEMLRKINNDVAVFKRAIIDILLHSNLQLTTNSELDIQIDSRTYIYYSIVCIKRDTKGVMTFLRSKDRGHMPNVWDFDQQKNAQRVSGEDVIIQIEDKFRNNFGLNIKVIKDEERHSLIPMDIHPIYRRGELHNGILCFAYIEDNETEENILEKVNGKLKNVVSGYGYSLYSKVQFIHEDQINVDKPCCTMNGNEIQEITIKEAQFDSTTWNIHNKKVDEKCAPNFALTIRDAINYQVRESEIR